MRIALCTGSFVMGGVGSSLRILCAGMQAAGHQCDIVLTASEVGNDYKEGLKEGLPIKTFCEGERWLRKRFHILLDHLSEYDVVINNHSTETQLIIPALPKHIIRLSVIRSTNDAVISGACLNSGWLDALVGLTPVTKQLLENVDVECQIHVIPNASRIESDIFPDLGKSINILYLGRLTDIDKNILILPEIIVECKKLGFDFSITIAGDGPDRSILEEKIAKLGVSDTFTMLGTVPRESLAKLLSTFNCLLLPSNYEGLSLSLIEAMAAGCVPVTSKIPPNSWVLGEAGIELQATVKDAKAYADRIQMLATDPNGYREMQKRLRRRQRENFTPKATVGSYLRMVEELSKGYKSRHFEPIPFKSLPLPKYYKRRCTRTWRLLQYIKYNYF